MHDVIADLGHGKHGVLSPSDGGARPARAYVVSADYHPFCRMKDTAPVEVLGKQIDLSAPFGKTYAVVRQKAAYVSYGFGVSAHDVHPVSSAPAF